MGTRGERRAARALVTTCHEAELANLIERVGEVIESQRAGEADVFLVDEVIHRHEEAAPRGG